MFERFTDRARRVVVRAQEEARLLNHNYIGTEHLLLGVVHDAEGVAARSLRAIGVSLETVRAQVEEIIGHGQSTPTGHIPFTPRAKKVLELSLREALQLGHNYIGTEHILLGIIREGEGVAAQVLVKLGADLSRVREQVVQLVGEEDPPPASGAVSIGRVTESAGPRAAAGVSRLVRVVPIAREVQLAAGRRLVLLSLEVWSGWLDLRLAVLRPDPAEGRPQRVAGYGDWALSDDLGTAYQRVGASSAGDGLFQFHQVSFVPSPPPDASTLTLTLPAAENRDEIQVVVELR